MPRLFVDKGLYLQQQRALQALLEVTPKITLVPGSHNINMIPEDLNIHFIASGQMKDFELFKESDIKTLKLINYGNLAVELYFFLKHKYFVDKKQTEESMCGILQTYQNDLREQQQAILLSMKKAYATLPMNDMKDLVDVYMEKMDLLNKQAAYWSEMEGRLEDMEYVVSNYEHNFQYYELGYKYWDAELLEYVIYNSHMVKNQTNRNGEITQERHNIIFVDEKAIAVPIPNQHKVVEKFLATFPEKFKLGTRMVYFKPKGRQDLNQTIIKIKELPPKTEDVLKIIIPVSEATIKVQAPKPKKINELREIVPPVEMVIVTQKPGKEKTTKDKSEKIVKVKPEKTKKIPASSKSSQFSMTAEDLKKEDKRILAQIEPKSQNYSEINFEISLKKIAPHLPNAVISQAFNMIEKQLLREILVKKTKEGYLLKIPNNSLIELDEAMYKLIKDMENVADFEGCDFDRIYAVALDDSGLIWR